MTPSIRVIRWPDKKGSYWLAEHRSTGITPIAEFGTDWREGCAAVKAGQRLAKERKLDFVSEVGLNDAEIDGVVEKQCLGPGHVWSSIGDTCPWCTAGAAPTPYKPTEADRRSCRAAVQRWRQGSYDEYGRSALRANTIRAFGWNLWLACLQEVHT